MLAAQLPAGGVDVVPALDALGGLDARCFENRAESAHARGFGTLEPVGRGHIVEWNQVHQAGHTAQFGSELLDRKSVV